MTVTELQSGVRQVNVGLASDFRETINDNFEIIRQFLNEYTVALQNAGINLGLPVLEVNNNDSDNDNKIAVVYDNTKIIKLSISLTSVFRKRLYNNFMVIKNFIINYYTKVSNSSIGFLTIKANGMINSFNSEISVQRREVLTRIIDNGIIEISFYNINGPILATDFKDKINTNFNKIVDFITEFDVEMQTRVYLPGIHPVPESQ